MFEKIKKLFNVEKKGYSLQNLSVDKNYSFRGFLNDYGWHRLLSWDALRYYQKIEPLSSGLNKITDPMSSIPLQVKKQDGTLSTDEPVLQRLNQPNSDFTWQEFLTQIYNYYKLTGNSYIIATGNVTREPLELWSMPPQYVEIKADRSDGYVEYYKVSYNSVVEYFYREEINGVFRFYNTARDKEFWHIRTFNPYYGANDLYGSSPLNSLYYELEQYEAANVHNYSLLERGAYILGILMFENVLPDDQYRRLKEQFNNYYSGASNAGKTFFADGAGKGDYKPLMQSNRDMNFFDLKKDTRLQIYNSLKVPLALVSPDHMTMSNYQEARLALYDEAVLPGLSRILKELSNFLMYRYSPEDEITYDENDISVIKNRNLDYVLKLKETQSLTYNDLRQKLGMDDIQGGDVLYQSNTLVQVGAEQVQQQQERNEEIERFALILDKQGKTEKEIKELVKKYYDTNYNTK